MNKKFDYENSVVVIAKYRENTDWITKLNKFKNVFVYEKENPKKEPYNVPKNKGNESSAYIKYIIDNYDNLPNHLVLLHCHEFSWHHKDSIVDVVDNCIGTEIEYKNLNEPICIMYYDWSNNNFKKYYDTFIKPAIGNFMLYDDSDKLGCAQFIVHKDRIMYHSIDFYKDIYNWILNDNNLSNADYGYYLEWTWELFWNRCLQNTPIKLYENEKLLYAFQLDKKMNYDNDITDIVVDELQKNNHFKVIDNIKIIICKNNVISKEIIATKYIYNKLK